MLIFEVTSHNSKLLGAGRALSVVKVENLRRSCCLAVTRLTSSRGALHASTAHLAAPRASRAAGGFGTVTSGSASGRGETLPREGGDGVVHS